MTRLTTIPARCSAGSIRRRSSSRTNTDNPGARPQMTIASQPNCLPAIANPLLDEISLRGARGVLINITGSHDLTLFELDEAANRIREEVDAEAHIIVGSTLDPSMEGVMRVSVVATGIDMAEGVSPVHAPRRSMAEPLIVEQAPRVAEREVAAAPVFEPVAADVGESLGTLFDDVPVDDTVELKEAGDPSADALRRLRAAVAKVPVEEDEPQVEEAPAAEGQGRFAINNLINRMTGHGPNTDVPAARRHPPLHEQEAQTFEDIDEEEQDRVEIPAFLRRQAN